MCVKYLVVATAHPIQPATMTGFIYCLTHLLLGHTSHCETMSKAVSYSGFINFHVSNSSWSRPRSIDPFWVLIGHTPCNLPNKRLFLPWITAPTWTQFCHLEDGDTILLWNISVNTQSYTASKPRRLSHNNVLNSEKISNYTNRKYRLLLKHWLVWYCTPSVQISHINKFSSNYLHQYQIYKSTPPCFGYNL